MNMIKSEKKNCLLFVLFVFVIVISNFNYFVTQGVTLYTGQLFSGTERACGQSMIQLHLM